MDKKELATALVAVGHVEREQDAEAILDALASIIWHALEHGDEVDWPRVGRFSVGHTTRHRRAVAFQPASELEVAVNRHHVTA
jgi:nucleoid DNA-binding protein